MSQLEDEFYDALSNVQRRRLLFELLEESPQTVSPRDRSGAPIDTKSNISVRSKQHHVHLPKLDEYGFVDWNPELKCVERGPRFDEIRPVLERLEAKSEAHTTYE